MMLLFDKICVTVVCSIAVSFLCCAYGQEPLTTKATQYSSENTYDNIQKDDATGLGGSGPVKILFESYVSDDIRHIEWQIARDIEFLNITERYNLDTFEYEFRNSGTVYVRCVASNFDGSREYYGETYTVTISDSILKIPNFFSPDGDGVNDEWKVIFKSISVYECQVFNRSGQLLFHTSDPSKGWDGKQNGKYVGSGVYYYIINATGTDGIRYKKSGDINIINRTIR